MILVDANVLIDILERDPQWFDWSYAQILQLAQDDKLFINSVVVAEVAPEYNSLERFASLVEGMEVKLMPLSHEAAFAAGAAFRTYRRRRKQAAATMVLPDFFIGGHALVLNAKILTRDPRFYRAYFPTVELIAPAKDIK